jgi:hypothetical protein
MAEQKTGGDFAGFAVANSETGCGAATSPLRS